MTTAPLYGKLYEEAFQETYDGPFRFPKSGDDSPYGLSHQNARISKLLASVCSSLCLIHEDAINDTTRGILLRHSIRNRLDLARKGIPEEISDEHEIAILHDLIKQYNLDTIIRNPYTTLQGHAVEILKTLDPTLD